MRRTVLALAALAFLAAPALAQGGGGMMQMLMAQDANGDGAITMDEARAARLARFRALDANGDGQLNAAERRAAGGGMMMQAALGGADSNHDGAVSQAEFMAMPYRMFEFGDSNHDNTLDAAEIAALRSRAPR